MLRRRKQIFGDYAADILRNSMVTGLPQIAHAANPAKKLIRVLVLIACLTGFIYQSLDFMNLYWQYKTIANAYVEATRVTEEPSFTICNLNGIYRSRICNDPRFMSNCSKFESSNWCKCSDGRWCNNGSLEDTKVAGWELIEKISEMEYEDYKMLLQKLDEFFETCINDEGTPCDLKHAHHTRCPSRIDDAIESCWTLNTVIGRPEIEPKRMDSTEEKFLVVLPHLEEYPDYFEGASVYISIHNARQILNPFNLGFRMEPNKVIEFRLKKAVTKLLPAPYETNCVDYIERWKSRGGHGPTNQGECFDECRKNLSLQVLGCVSSGYGIPGHEKYCSSAGKTKLKTSMIL
ncbi:uncharacterized protein [Parasteatoda tepidariorum]|uniref:uncharacterized protein n=1 Tax=Parasteatoda tepidariorum TaxID=114398 RepID=UPI0039BC326F